MQAVRIHRFGGPEVISIEEIVRPTATVDEVLIKVFAASDNPVDERMREGKYPVATEKYLHVLGLDVRGEIAAIGSDVAGFPIGADVFAFLSPQQVGYEEFILARADEVAANPRPLDAVVAAAAIPLAGITAWQGLFDHGGLQSGQRVLIQSGAGGVGHFAIQFAKARGAWIATTK
ncbi:NADP-dependent oxidoreductase [Ferranicluibacter rubi]|uniref:NADP-dependent oxidoreductase n=1 Tax=Ferranicluibacter rubi TaxID=2715133 RepID=UPI00248D0E30|nr:NADP-dependent oxidoreductase [Ferranicluibacter rubi]